MEAIITKLVETPDSSTVDPNYREPPMRCKFKEAMTKISYYDNDWAARNEQASLLGFMLSRIEVLETALMPFAKQALALSSANMSLRVTPGREKEPAGGTWISNPPDGVVLSPNEGLFYNACDAFGRKHIQDLMIAMFNKLQEDTKEQEAKNAHVQAGGTIH